MRSFLINGRLRCPLSGTWASIVSPRRYAHSFIPEWGEGWRFGRPSASRLEGLYIRAFETLRPPWAGFLTRLGMYPAEP